MHPFEMWEFNIYLTKTNGQSNILREWEKLNAGQDIESFQDFVKIYAFFRKAQALFGVRNKHYQGLITRSLQLPHTPLTAFSQTDLFLD